MGGHASPRKKHREARASPSIDRSATLRVVPKGQHRLRKAETPRLTAYGAQRHGRPRTIQKKSTAKRVPPQASIGARLSESCQKTSISLRKAETPRLTAYGAQRHGRPRITKKKAPRSACLPKHRQERDSPSRAKRPAPPPQSGDSSVNRLWSAATWAATHHSEEKHREARASPSIYRSATLRVVPKDQHQPPQSGDSTVNRLWSAATWAATHHQEKSTAKRVPLDEYRHALRRAEVPLTTYTPTPRPEAA